MSYFEFGKYFSLVIFKLRYNGKSADDLRRVINEIIILSVARITETNCLCLLSDLSVSGCLWRHELQLTILHDECLEEYSDKSVSKLFAHGAIKNEIDAIVE